MLPGINPRQMRQAMKRLGIQQEELSAELVIIRTGSKDIVIRNPQVSKVNMMGQWTYQISGEEEARPKEISISEEDLKTVMEQAKCSREEALKSLKDSNGDLAEAILSLKN